MAGRNLLTGRRGNREQAYGARVSELRQMITQTGLRSLDRPQLRELLAVGELRQEEKAEWVRSAIESQQKNSSALEVIEEREALVELVTEEWIRHMREDRSLPLIDEHKKALIQIGVTQGPLFKDAMRRSLRAVLMGARNARYRQELVGEWRELCTCLNSLDEDHPLRKEFCQELAGSFIQSEEEDGSSAWASADGEGVWFDSWVLHLAREMKELSNIEGSEEEIAEEWITRSETAIAEVIDNNLDSLDESLTDACSMVRELAVAWIATGVQKDKTAFYQMITQLGVTNTYHDSVVRAVKSHLAAYKAGENTRLALKRGFES